MGYTHDPVSAIAEAEATGEIAELFADIRQTMQLGCSQWGRGKEEEKKPTLAGGPSRTERRHAIRKMDCLSDAKRREFPFFRVPERSSGPAGKVLIFGSLDQAKEHPKRDHAATLLIKKFT